MKITYINTQNIMIAKDMIIRTAIKLNLQYIEMPDEVIIEGTYLYRFIEKEHRYIDFLVTDIICEQLKKIFLFQN